MLSGVAHVCHHLPLSFSRVLTRVVVVFALSLGCDVCLWWLQHPPPCWHSVLQPVAPASTMIPARRMRRRSSSGGSHGELVTTSPMSGSATRMHVTSPANGRRSRQRHRAGSSGVHSATGSVNDSAVGSFDMGSPRGHVELHGSNDRASAPRRHAGPARGHDTLYGALAQSMPSTAAPSPVARPSTQPGASAPLLNKSTAPKASGGDDGSDDEEEVDRPCFCWGGVYGCEARRMLSLAAPLALGYVSSQAMVCGCVCGCVAACADQQRVASPRLQLACHSSDTWAPHTCPLPPSLTLLCMASTVCEPTLVACQPQQLTSRVLGWATCLAVGATAVLNAMDPLCSQAFGAGKLAKVGLWLQVAILWSTVLFVPPLVAIWWFAGDIMHVFGAVDTSSVRYPLSVVVAHPANTLTRGCVWLCVRASLWI